MIAGIFHKGSGLGNQLHRYVATRCLALDKGYQWGMIYPDNFKGKSFLKLQFAPLEHQDFSNRFEEKCVRDENGVDIRGYDPEINFVNDYTIIDGEFQDPRYFEHRLEEIKEWLKVEPLDVPDDTCIINFRGGEYAGVPDLFLGLDYWGEALQRMRDINPKMKFEIHTDDANLAGKTLLGFPIVRIVHDMEINWRSLRYAKYAIISNSSFAILPRLLSGGVTIAPRYWARRNIGVWALPQNYYKQFTYI